ncbi:MAG: flagellar type III secretion system protein FlhA [Candidatus Dadabacteria bacterium]|nr:MAG: flagellar type III secretion system protein FlhA [Candidatus Dadabacteria bacterium]
MNFDRLKLVLMDARIGATIALSGFLILMLVPLPPSMLDLLITFSLMLSVGLLLTALFLRESHEFFVFPSLLLITTLFRLGLNIASTRLILLGGASGQNAAGAVIEAFGRVVMGGNYVVGGILFLIFSIINFIVISKGSERVAEVSARFTLDALPGKQMSIDADLTSGMIDQEQARVRRQELQREAEFYGAMDGASKFVRGDAIASLLIAFVNLLGGALIGALQHGMTLSEAASRFSILTVGDGLAAQVPALLVSTAAGLVITQVGGDNNMARELVRQLGSDRKIWLLTASIFGVFGLMPGMPSLAFIGAAAVFAAAAWFVPTLAADDLDAEDRTEERPPALIERPADLEIVLGLGLLSITGEQEGGGLLRRLKRWREDFARTWGFWLPVVSVHDDQRLASRAYEIRAHGVVLAQGELRPNRMLALDTGQLSEVIVGDPASDPVFGANGWWIPRDQQRDAERKGAVVVPPAVVLLTHLTEIITPRMQEFFGRATLRALLTDLRDQGYTELDELVPAPLDYGRLLSICHALLAERVPLTGLRTIIETAASICAVSANAAVAELVEAVRQALSSQICSRLADPERRISVLTLAPDVETALARVADQTGSSGEIALLSEHIGRLLPSLREKISAPEGPPSAILVSPAVRRPLRNVLAHALPDLPVLSLREIARGFSIETRGTVGFA